MKKAVSGGMLERPAFYEMMAFVRQQDRGGIAVIIDDISRFARDIESHWTLRRTLKETGGKLESPSITFGEDSDSILIENLLASVSQHQRQKNGEQTKNRVRARALNGYWCFAAPPGYRYEKVSGRGKMLVRDEPFASIIAEALEGFALGWFQTQCEIKRFLEDQPAFAARFPDGCVRYEEVVRLLRRPHYAGYIEVPRWGLPLRKAQHEGLISLETWQRNQERVREGARVAARKDINADFPLRGFVTCGECDHPLTSCWSKSKTGKKHPYYMCFHKGCENYRKSIKRDEMEGAFADVLETLKPAPSLMSVASDMFRRLWNHRAAAAKDATKTYRRDITRLEKQIESLLDRVVEAESKSVIAAYEKRIAQLEQDKAVLREKVDSNSQPVGRFDDLFELACAFLANPQKLWASGRIELQRLVLKLAFTRRIAYDRFEPRKYRFRSNA